MIEILKPSEQGTCVLGKPESECWINVVSPTEEEITQLKAYVDIPEELLHSLKDKDEIPAIIQTEQFTFLIIRTPFNNPQIELEYFTVPVGIFMTKQLIVTVCYFENDTIAKLKTRKFDFRKTQLVFRLLLVSARLYLNYLSDINKKIYSIEAALEQTQKNKAIMELLELQKDLVYFSTSLKSNEILIERILKDNVLIRTADDKRLLEKVIDENTQAIEMTSIYSNILTSTMDAFTSIISNNLNMVIKMLTSLTVVIAIPTLIASIYGMNVKLPFQDHPHAFMIVIIISFVISSASGYYLWKKNFF
jgi:magnesium transporter